MLRGSNGIDYKDRIKIMKLLWDAIGTEFGARHELYEMNYSEVTNWSAFFRCSRRNSPANSSKWKRWSTNAWPITTKTAGASGYRDGKDISVLGKV